MAKTTKPKQYKSPTFIGSISSAWGALTKPGKQFYILEHKTASRYHKAGENQKIIVDRIEIGRDPRCAVRFDESFDTVSRRHAAIVRQGNRHRLINLSPTNNTLVNGKDIRDEWFLEAGDEIQLSLDGPRLGFIILQGKQSMMGSIFTRDKARLLMEQFIRPYRKTINILIIALILAIGGLTGWKIWSDMEYEKKIAAIEAEAEKQYETFISKQDSLANELNKTGTQLLDEKARSQKMQSDFDSRLNELKDSLETVRTTTVNKISVDNQAIDVCLPYIYFIYVESIEAISPTGEKKIINDTSWSGTGFLLDDGRFVTARHVVEPWFFAQKGDENQLLFNLLTHNGGNVIVHYAAISSSGDRFSFTNENMVCTRAHDKSFVSEEGLKYVAGYFDETDWAYYKTNRTEGLSIDRQVSISLERGTELTILGFPMGIGVNSVNDINPILSKAITASAGLNRNVILTTNTTYERGNSGGPVFYTDADGKLIVIGIVSASAGRSTGFIVPIASLY